MSKKPMSKKLKVGAVTVNLMQVAALVFLEAVLYRIISYKNYLLLDYLPVKYIVFAQIILVVLTITPFFIKWGRKRTIISIVYSAIMIIAFVTAGVLGCIYEGQIQEMILKTDSTLDKVVENSGLSTDEYGIYVLKTDTAESLEDVADDTFAYREGYSTEDTMTVIRTIEGELGKVIDYKEVNDPVKLAQNLLNGKNRVVILNQSLIDLIESAGEDLEAENAGDFTDFTEKIKCIYTVNIKNELTKKKDAGDVTKKCFTVYISGIDTEGDVTVKSRSDVNIIMSINPITHNIILISTPRDYYVPLSISNGVKDKLTHAGNYGIDVSMDTLEMLYDIELDYFVRLNFTGFVNIIDALGGIDVESDYSFSTHGYSYTEGLNENLSGIQALWFARERHAFAAGDRQRGKDQMKVIEAVIKKCQSTALLSNYVEILNDISESFQTDMEKKSVKELVKFQLNKAPEWNVITYSVSGTGRSDYTYSIPSARAYVMEPDQTTIDTAKQLLEDNENNQEISEQRIKELESAEE
jgi:LCP family protein required for cell wall assembly